MRDLTFDDFAVGDYVVVRFRGHQCTGHNGLVTQVVAKSHGVLVHVDCDCGRPDKWGLLGSLERIDHHSLALAALGEEYFV